MGHRDELRGCPLWHIGDIQSDVISGLAEGYQCQVLSPDDLSRGDFLAVLRL
jgi:hypothetical protein